MVNISSRASSGNMLSTFCNSCTWWPPAQPMIRAVLISRDHPHEGCAIHLPEIPAMSLMLCVAALIEWERGPQQHSVVSAISDQVAARDANHSRTSTPSILESLPARADAPAQPPDGNAQQSISRPSTQHQPSDPVAAQQLMAMAPRPPSTEV